MGVNPYHHSLAREYYIEMLYALQHAFATGEFEAFIDVYPALPYGIHFNDPGRVASEWPALFRGITAAMSFNADDFIPRFGIHWRDYYVTVNLYVSGGNDYLPNGNQTLELGLAPNQHTGTPKIFSMMLNTDGRLNLFYLSRLENPTLEEQMLPLVSLFSTWVHCPAARTYWFLFLFDDWLSLPTEEEIIAGAKKFLAIEYLPPASEWGLYRLDDGTYTTFNPPTGGGYPMSAGIIETPSQGDFTVRVFFYDDWFMLTVYRMTDFNFLILYEDDGTPYARLLSEQVVPLS